MCSCLVLTNREYVPESAEMDRSLQMPIGQDLEERIVLITGPRQSGKTTLSKMLHREFEYFNYDVAEDRLRLQEKSWDRKKPLVIFILFVSNSSINSPMNKVNSSNF